MSTAARKVTKVMNIVVNVIIAGMLLLMAAYGGYAIWDSYTIVNQAEAEAYAMYKPTEDAASFAELKVMNPEVFGWLTIYGTNIDYPLVQAADNWKYINYSATGIYSLTGAIFLDYQNRQDFSDFNSIIFGHNMTPRVMFGNIKEFKEQAFFDSHKYGDIYYGDRHYGIELFALLKADGYDRTLYRPGVEGSKEQQEYLDYIMSIATHKRDVGVTINDRIVLLSTCSNTESNGRDILAGRITDQTYKDEFAVAQEGRLTEKIDPQNILLWWKALPIWQQGLIIVVLILLIAAILHRIKKHRDTMKGEQTKLHEK